MTTMQEALADRYLQAAEVPDFLADTADLMQRSFANPKYGNEGLALTNGESASDNDGRRAGIPTRAQNKIRSGRAGRKAARSRQTLQAVGGLSYKGPWDAIKASTKPADYVMCKLESEVKNRPAGTATTHRGAGGSSKGTSNATRTNTFAAAFAAAKTQAGGA